MMKHSSRLKQGKVDGIINSHYKITNKLQANDDPVPNPYAKECRSHRLSKRVDASCTPDNTGG